MKLGHIKLVYKYYEAKSKIRYPGEYLEFIPLFYIASITGVCGCAALLILDYFTGQLNVEFI